MFAVIQTGGKQYRVKEKDTLTVEKLPQKVGESVDFKDILLLADEEGKTVKLGKPTVSGAAVSAKVLEQGRAPKVTVVKFKSKVRYKRKVGHRQPFTKLLIEKITA